MKRSQLFLPTLKENPSEASIISHRLMLRSGMIRQSSSGIYTWLPLGYKVLKNIENIIRSEQNLISQELLMPTIQDSEIWKKSGRFDDYGKEMLKFKDRHEHELLYGPTNEELITDIFSKNVVSYKSLPMCLYHIQWKFRDEIRPRFGVMRGREFLMKDAYSFDENKEDAIKCYNRMFLSYLRIFKKMDLKAIPVAADTGPIGGDLSHEFIILADTGESDVYLDKNILGENIPNIKYDEPLAISDLVDKLTSYYTAADDKHNEDIYIKSVKENDRLKTRGIEVGHLFYFGNKYSKPLEANITNNDGQNIPVEMGSYGIGVSRLVGAIIDAHNDDKGIYWPESVAPYMFGIVNLRQDDNACRVLSESIYNNLIKSNIEVLYDDRNEGAGIKLAEMDLIGIPWQIRIGPRGLKNGYFELMNRKTGKTIEVNVNEANNIVKNKF
ncbi:MAG: proline--tRNA ligase [Pelagibacterales bacterium]|nr:proline--tRNA ligase [Pelagibacterales bacterium]OUV26960.1 MAG: proline--tRNA ligase [Alphaproteobacteria bacterium TMED109]